MKNILSLILISQLVLIGCGSSSKEKESKEKRANLHYTHGTDALLKKDYTTALDHLLKSNTLKPNQAKTLNNLGMAYLFKNQQELALRTILMALKIDPKNSDARTNLASAYLQIGNLEKAEEHYRIVLKDLIYKHQYRVHYNLSLIELRRSNYSKAIQELKKSVGAKKDYCPANFKLGQLAARRFDYHSALKYYRDATKGTCYNLAQPHIEQANTLIQLKEYTTARLKLSDIKNQFKGTRFATIAKAKLNDLDNLEKQEYYSNKNKTINNFYNQ